MANLCFRHSAEYTEFSPLFFFRPCHAAYGLQSPDQESNLCPLQWQRGAHYTTSRFSPLVKKFARAPGARVCDWDMRTSSEVGSISILRRHRPPREGAVTQLSRLQGTETQDRARSLLGLVVLGLVRKRAAESVVCARPRETAV